MSNLIVFRNLALGKVERNGMLQYSQSPLETREFDSASLNHNDFFFHCGVCVSSFDTGKTATDPDRLRCSLVFTAV